MASTHVVVDGSNIATEGRSLPSLAQLDEAVQAFLAEHPHDVVTVVVDATFGHRIDSKERAQYEEAVLAGEIVSPPAGAVGRGDAFVLQIADKAGATILSNDSFQEFHGTHPWLFDTGRLIGGKPVEHVGWIFLPRTPVRGPTSRKATRSAKPSTSKTPPESSTRDKTRGAKTDQSATKQPAKKEPAKKEPAKASSRASKASAPDKGQTRSGGSGRSPSRDEPLNAPMTFINFVASHPVGSEVQGEVERFSSHGAYVSVGDAQCYVPLKSMGDPPPRRARDILTLGESRSFVVQSFDTPRRGIDLALADAASTASDESKAGASDAIAVPDPDGDHRASNEPAGTTTRTRRPTSVATKKTTAKKAPAKKAPAKKTAVAKAPAKKAPAKKAPAKKTSAAKAPAKKAPAKKAPAKKTSAAKAPAKKAPAKKAPAKKTAAAKKAPAKKTSAAKAPAKKAPAKKAPAKKTSAAKAPAKKAPAKKTSAAKAPAKKAPAKKAPAKKS